MKCPYNTAINQVEQITFEQEDGETTQQQPIVRQEVVWPDCLGPDCAAWGDGKCCYHGR